MELSSSEGSAGLDVQDDSLTQLAVDAGCWPGAPSGTVNQTAYICLSCIRVVGLLTWGLTSLPEQASQGDQAKTAWLLMT